MVHGIKRRIERDIAEAKAAEMLAATYVLLGLRYDRGIIAALKREVLKMEESITYQEIKGLGRVEGFLEEARRIILRQGKKRSAEAAERLRKQWRQLPT